MDNWLKFYELITKPLPVASSLFLFFATSFLLLAGDPTLARLGLSRAITNYRWAVGLGFIISVAWLVVTGLLLLWKWIITLRKKNERKKRLHALAADERRILSQYVQNESRSCIFNAAPDIAAAHGLADDGVLYKPDAQPDGAAVAYNILEWALAYLSQHRELLAATVPSETRWKSEIGLNMKTFLRVMAAFAGIVVGLTLVGIGLNWYASRPKREKPWNVSAIKASSTQTLFSIQDDRAVGDFRYSLQNTTDRDYRLPADAKIMLRLAQDMSYRDVSDMTWDHNLYIPAGQKVNISISLPIMYADYNFSKSKANDEKQLAPFMDRRLAEIDGFVLFDPTNRYKVDFPNGWPESVKRAKEPKEKEPPRASGSDLK